MAIGLNEREKALLRAHLAEKMRREREALRLYEPTPIQTKFHSSKAAERLVIGGSRAGKSLCCYIELARALLGLDPYKKYPTDRPITAWLICYEEGNIGRTAFRLLFKPGAFHIIRDPQTGKWRNWRPWEEWDRQNSDKTKLAGPIIPRRYAPSTAFHWIKKRARIFRRFEPVFPEGHPMEGTELYVFSSASEVPMGDPVDLIMIDEDIQYADHYPELQARLSDRKGRIIWSAKPKTKNDAMISLARRCEDQRTMDQPDAELFRLVYSENPYIDDEEKQKRLRNWTEAERLVHDYGEFATDLVLLYPEFDLNVHVVPRLEGELDAMERAVAAGQVPADWTRYMVVDPGFSVTAALFFAVPPPSYGDYVLLYDEAYLTKCTPAKFADAVAKKVADQQFYAFIIDDHGSRQRSAATGKSVRHHYREELALRNVRSYLTGSDFLKGSDDVAGRTTALRRWLSPRADARPKFCILRDACPHTIREFRTCRRRVVHNEARDERVDRAHHALDCIEYLCAYDPRYHRPQQKRQHVPLVVQEFREWMARENKNAPKSIHLGPGPAPAPARA